MTDPQIIRDHVDQNRQKYLDRYFEALRIPSISAEGQGLHAMASWLIETLTELGAEVTTLTVPDAAPALLATIGDPSGGSVMVYDHYDVQPVDPIDLWDSPPFEPVIRNDRVYARGAADNKGDLIARLCAIETYRDLYGDLPYQLKFFIEGEEESASQGFEQICHDHADALKADACIWEGGWFNEHGIPLMYYGCKGLLYVELRRRLLTGDQHSSAAAIVPSAAWEVLRAIASMKDDEGRIVIDGFYDGIVEPQGREAELIAKLPFDEDDAKQRLGIERFERGVSGESLRRALLLEPTANIAGFISGYTVPGASKTVLPAEAMAKMDFRLVPGQDADDIAEKVRRHLDKHGFDKVEMQVLGAEHPSRSPMDTPLGEAVEAAVQEFFGVEPVIHPWMAATGPMHPIASGLGIPICSPPGVGRPDAQIHAPNENARVEDFLSIVGYTVAYLRRYGNS